ncbi:hypothetical protein WICPIJ_005910 [Wickerhamomyces pijperi]|uniref:Uncharacterized protein n=1 Tax=Wickerhamomyces pijperi TaxID=599730 RepID=A0A9P8Q4U8_WICPI|nr:hypothetical protein WICPIJ_005910 [Wickerhamomyces pijperi]
MDFESESERKRDLLVFLAVVGVGVKLAEAAASAWLRSSMKWRVLGFVVDILSMSPSIPMPISSYNLAVTVPAGERTDLSPGESIDLLHSG